MPGSLPRPSSNGEADHTESVADQTSSLAIQLQAARLKRTNKVYYYNYITHVWDLIWCPLILSTLKQHPAENSGSSTSSASSGGSGNYGTLGRNANGGQTGMASMMDEMARTLARRRAAVEKKEPIDCPQVSVEFGTFPYNIYNYIFLYEYIFKSLYNCPKWCSYFPNSWNV